MTIPSASAAGFDYPFTCNQASLTADFAQRDGLPHTTTPADQWYSKSDEGGYLNGGWGPNAAALPPVAVPSDAGCAATTWKQERILSAALHYVNDSGNAQALQYRHHHIPDWNPTGSTEPAGGAKTTDLDGQSPQTWAAGRGLDCSNFTAWVYNYGLGIGFGGDVGGPGKALQGNIDPNVLFANPAQISDEVARVLDSFGTPHTGTGAGPTHIFNLGHGISQHTPPEHVAALVDAVHTHSRQLRQG